ncbi:MAG: hypothetical protein IKT46_04745 [Clostridia bacterium]|nr:hypothetical protein [Clostridia bacterium]
MANIDLITGFLGAGKTTFIRKYCRYLDSIGISYAVIENEYGTKGIDLRILQADGITTDELFGGCICCTLKVGFHDMLYTLSDKVDRIIVEPSGVYDVSQFFDVLSSEALDGRCKVGNIISVVDPTRLDSLDDLSCEMLKRQVMCAGGVIFSMDCDRSYLPMLESITGSKVDLIDYNDLEALSVCGYFDVSMERELTHSAGYLSTVVKPLPCEDMEERILKLFSDSNVGRVLRVKGFWNGYLVNAISGHIDIYKCDGEEGLNVIGLDISRKKITEVLNNGLN